MSLRTNWLFYILPFLYICIVIFKFSFENCKDFINLFKISFTFISILFVNFIIDWFIYKYKAYKIDSQVSSMARALHVIANTIYGPGRNKNGSDSKYECKYDFSIEPDDEIYKKRELFEWYAIRDNEYLAPFDCDDIYPYDELKEVELYSIINCLRDTVFYVTKELTKKEGINEWEIGTNKADYFWEFEKIDNFISFINDKFKSAISLTDKEIRKINPKFIVNPFKRFFVVKNKPVHYQTLLDCNELLTTYKYDIIKVIKKNIEI